MTLKFKETWDDHHSFHFQYLENDKMIGRFYLEVHDEYVLLMSLYVQPKFRKKGIGKKMVKQAIRTAVKLKKPFMLMTNQDWKTAWYESFGFTVMQFEEDQSGYQDNLAGYNWLEYKI